MAGSGRQGDGPSDPESTGATEPITLTDPDGSVTRVAPWSSWTREQVRAPGGEPALVTRLDQGQLWFSAGRRRSPWRHEVHVGPAVVSTPRGRFQAIAEPDGGATIACLAGRTRVVAGLREPVLLGPDQSAAVSSDGRTLVVMDRATGDEITEPDIIDLTETDEAEIEAPELAAVGSAAVGAGGNGGQLAASPGFDRIGPDLEPTPAPEPTDEERRPARLGWIPELVAVAAIIGLLIAGVWVFSQSDGDTDQSASPAITVPITGAPTSSSSTIGSTATTEPVATTDTVATTEPTATTDRPTATGAVGIGQLESCRRAEGGVLAKATVSHRSGPASTFIVSVALVDPEGVEYARGTGETAVIQPGGTATADVLVKVAGPVEGSCEVLEVTSG